MYTYNRTGDHIPRVRIQEGPLHLLYLNRARSSAHLLLRPPRPLLENVLLSLVQDGRLPLVDSLQPVSEACTYAGEDGVGPEGFLEEKRSHLDTELPGAGCKT